MVLKQKDGGVIVGKEGNEEQQWDEAVWHQIGPHWRGQALYREGGSVGGDDRMSVRDSTREERWH